MIYNINNFLNCENVKDDLIESGMLFQSFGPAIEKDFSRRDVRTEGIINSVKVLKP